MSKTGKERQVKEIQEGIDIISNLSDISAAKKLKKPNLDGLDRDDFISIIVHVATELRISKQELIKARHSRYVVEMENAELKAKLRQIERAIS